MPYRNNRWINFEKSPVMFSWSYIFFSTQVNFSANMQSMMQDTRIILKSSRCEDQGRNTS